MIKLLKLLSVIMVTLFVTSSYSYSDKIRGEYATKNMLGQEYYMQRCSSCHGDGARGGNMASIRDWKQIFTNNASELVELHTDDDSTVEILSYLKSDSFKKESVLMLKLLQEFAYDSENIPTCN